MASLVGNCYSRCVGRRHGNLLVLAVITVGLHFPQLAAAQDVQVFERAGGRDGTVLRFIGLTCSAETRQRLGQTSIRVTRQCGGGVMGNAARTIRAASNSVRTIAGNAASAACNRALAGYSLRSRSLRFTPYPHYGHADPSKRPFTWVGATIGDHSCRKYDKPRGYRCFGNWQATCTKVEYRRADGCRLGFFKDAYGHCVPGRGRGRCRAGYYRNAYGHCIRGRKPCSTGHYKNAYGHCVRGRSRQSRCGPGYYENGYGHCVRGRGPGNPCSVGFSRNSYGHCVRRQGGQKGCRTGYHRNNYGHCVRTAQCPPGFVRNRSGSCSRVGRINSPCSAGYQRDSYGKCVRKGPQGCRSTGWYRNRYGHCVPGRSNTRPCRTGYTRTKYGGCVRAKPPSVGTSGGGRGAQRGGRSSARGGAKITGQGRFPRCRTTCTQHEVCTTKNVCKRVRDCRFRRVCDKPRRVCRGSGKHRRCADEMKCRNVPCKYYKRCAPKRTCRPEQKCKTVCK